MHVLGISAFYHDSAACLVRDGELLAAAQEERFTRKKHDASFPTHAVAYCLREAGIDASQLDLVAFYDKPLAKLDRLLETWLAFAPRGFSQFRRALPVWAKEKVRVPAALDRGLGGKYRGRFVFLEHHESHAASAFFPSPFEEAAVLTLDGVGEWATGSIAHGRGSRIELLDELRFPHSLGLLYSAFTYYCGFKVNSGEYKLMGLAPYGEPRFRATILDHLLTLKDDGSFRLNLDHFAFPYGDVMTSESFHSLFGGPPRRAESPLTQRDMDLAASIQAVTEEVVLRIARHAHARTGSRNLCLAGGVALNCVANGRVLREGPFERVWVQPAAGDAGGALGAALFCWHQLLGEKREPIAAPDRQKGSLLGPAYSDDECAAFLRAQGATFEHYDDEETLAERVAELLAEEKVVGHLAGRMELGPRALGARSILGDARSEKTQRTMNLKIKFRESFRPFAPAILREHVHEWLAMRPGEDSPYMLLVAPVLEARRRPVPSDLEGLAKLNVARSEIPAVTHVDFSARVQTLDEARHPRFTRIVRAFYRRTGVPVVVNTSFNVRSEPIVCSPEDAWRCFCATEMDALVLERCVVLREAQTNLPAIDREAHLAEFELD
jgi:carbamoyltransferase